MSKVKPLQKRTMTLDELQTRVIKLLKKVRKQFYRQAYEGGLSDAEFIEQWIYPLETEIDQDRQALRGAK